MTILGNPAPLVPRPEPAAMSRVLVTGGAGFIGSHFVRRLLAADAVDQVTVLDALTYAGSLENLGEAMLSPKLTFVPGSILDARLVAQRCAVTFAPGGRTSRGLPDRS
ncbi:NAD-dependent epimerase/dehydratase family protein [Streptomyces sp. NPDC127033]|uniref:NAD-dependent epimerase/dehydratase family protein n=1 Tax=Streptomyces sp. NPDC127033 TaxID=3347110 RepID=UPI0036649B24